VGHTRPKSGEDGRKLNSGASSLEEHFKLLDEAVGEWLEHQEDEQSFTAPPSSDVDQYEWPEDEDDEAIAQQTRKVGQPEAMYLRNLCMNHGSLYWEGGMADQPWLLMQEWNVVAKRQNEFYEYKRSVEEAAAIRARGRRF
jgi:hypothetical protein